MKYISVCIKMFRRMMMVLKFYKKKGSGNRATVVILNGRIWTHLDQIRRHWMLQQNGTDLRSERK
jgi:hypothetical protein